MVPENLGMIAQEILDSVFRTEFLICHEKKLYRMLRRDFVFEKGKSRKDTTDQPLLVILDATANELVRFFIILNAEWIAFPEF